MKLAQIVSFVPRLPFFRNDELYLIQALSEVGDDGVGRALPNTTRFTGAVNPSQSETLVRMLEGQSLAGAILITTSFPLSAGTETSAPDVVVWNGRRYQVRAVSDYAEGGKGIRVAACTQIDINPTL